VLKEYKRHAGWHGIKVKQTCNVQLLDVLLECDVVASRFVVQHQYWLALHGRANQDILYGVQNEPCLTIFEISDQNSFHHEMSIDVHRENKQYSFNYELFDHHGKNTVSTNKKRGDGGWPHLFYHMRPKCDLNFSTF